MRKKELLRQIAEKDARIAELEQSLRNMETRHQNLETLLDGYHAREQSVTEALILAEETARSKTEAAEKTAAETVSSANRIAEDKKAAAEAQAQRVVEEAKLEATGVLNEARAKSKEMLAASEAAVEEYKERLTGLNVALQQTAAAAAAGAKALAAFAGGRVAPVPQLEDALWEIQALPDRPTVVLPDAGDDPGQVMQNIYTLQNRRLPDEEAEEETAPIPEAPAEVQEEPENEGAQPVLSVPSEESSELERRLNGEEEEEDAPLPRVKEVLSGVSEDEAALDDILNDIIGRGDWNNGKEQ